MTLPESMAYIQMEQTGGPHQLRQVRGPVPRAAEGEVLIRVAAAGVNRPDVLQRQGLYPPPQGASSVLGLEVAGEVVALGKGVAHWQPGDKVCALVNGGGYAEYVRARADQCLPVPEGLALEEAAALPETAFTVWHNLWQRAGLKAGETLLIHGGASGIGTMAIQMAKAFGVEVIVTAGGPEKCRACEQLGADLAIDYHEQDFVKVVKTHTEGRGANVILDMVGGGYIQRNLSAAAKEGRIVNIAYLAGSRAEVDFLPVMVKRLTLTGSTLRAQSDAVKAGIARDLEARIWPLIDQGDIRPLVHHRFPMDRVGEAHELMESNQLIGKIILTYPKA